MRAIPVIGWATTAVAVKTKSATPSNVRFLAGLEQGRHRPVVNTIRAVRSAILQHAGAVHDGVESLKMRQPIAGRCDLGQVQAYARRLGAAREPHHGMTIGLEPGGQGLPDQPGAADDEDFHLSLARAARAPRPSPSAVAAMPSATDFRLSASSQPGVSRFGITP